MIYILLAIYLVIGLGIFFGAALMGESEPDNYGWLAIFWPAILVIGGALFIVVSPFAGMAWLFTRVSAWANKRKILKLEEKKRVLTEGLRSAAEVAVHPPALPEFETSQDTIDYRRMHCNACGHSIDKENEKEI